MRILITYFNFTAAWRGNSYSVFDSLLSGCVFEFQDRRGQFERVSFDVIASAHPAENTYEAKSKKCDLAVGRERLCVSVCERACLCLEIYYRIPKNTPHLKTSVAQTIVL